MLSLPRLLELAGRSLREDDAMSVEDAEAIFRRVGEAVLHLGDKAALRRSWIRLQRKYHEAGATPNPELMASINAAYSVLVRS
jgi:hypothetical protein